MQEIATRQLIGVTFSVGGINIPYLTHPYSGIRSPAYGLAQKPFIILKKRRRMNAPLLPKVLFTKNVIVLLL